MSNNPTVSVIIPSYNHAKFISEAIESVLNQTYQDLELVIVDDCSPDNSVDIISKFKDKRIRFYKNDVNQGAVYTTNYAISLSKGKYLALINSDDIWETNKLELQVKFLEENKEYDAVFSNASFVNEEKKALSKVEYFWSDVFDKENRSSSQWLRYFFYNFNCLCHPSILIKRELYNLTPMYDPSLRQLPDFKMWVHLLKFINIHVMKEKLVIFRVLSNNENASADTTSNRIRTRNEIYLIMKDFFDGMKKESFIEGFGDLLIKKEVDLTEEQVLCEQAFLYLNMKSDVSYIYKLIAIEKLHNLLRTEKTREVLQRDYAYTYKDYFKLTGEYELLDSSQNTIGNIVIENARKHLENQRTIYNILKNIYKRVFNRKNS